MASFDVESLFTNVPPTENTGIITNNITAESLSQFNLGKKQLDSLVNSHKRFSIYV